MKALVQRVARCQVTVNGTEVRRTGPGLLVLYGCAQDDTLKDCVKLAEKTANLRIFRDPEKRKAVNAILHPATFRQVLRLTEEAPEALVVYESAIPVEARFSELCDKILYLYAPRRDRTERLIRTRSYSPERCRNIMRSQPTEKEYRAMADAVLDNSGTPEETARRLKRLLKKWGLAERS